MTAGRLIRLSTTRAALSFHRLGSLNAWRAAPPEVRNRRDPEQRAPVDRAVREDRADVLATPFSPAG